MTDMTDKIVFRPFEKRDFEPLARVLERTWLANFPGRPGEVASRVELARYLTSATWSLVAERGGTLLGAVLLSERGHEAKGAAAWRELEEELRAEAQGDPALEEAVHVEMSGVEEEARVEGAYAQTGAPGTAAAVKLLIVSPDAKGLGIGGRLFSAALDHLREAGAPGYHLMTDDSCDVSFYEHKGLAQAMRRRSEAYWPGVDPAEDEFYVYVYDQEL